MLHQIIDSIKRDDKITVCNNILHHGKEPPKTLRNSVLNLVGFGVLKC